jgi:hypothetical protein
MSQPARLRAVPAGDAPPEAPVAASASASARPGPGAAALAAAVRAASAPVRLAVWVADAALSLALVAAIGAFVAWYAGLVPDDVAASALSRLARKAGDVARALRFR